MVRSRLVPVLAVLALGLSLQVTGVVAQDPVVCDPPDGVPTFTQNYIDTTRAGGEPIITTLQDGTMLWGSHAGTTHFFTPGLTENPAVDNAGGLAPFVQEYEGQTYYYWSDDNGENWTFAPRAPYETLDPTSGVNNSGFSDPEFAVDAAGNVFVSEINLANIAVSKSSDSGRTYTLQNFLGLTASDRQWMEADEEDVVYMSANTFGGGSLGDFPPGATGSTANRFYKSVDGGVTWSAGQRLFDNRQMSSDFKIDHATGVVYLLDTRLSGRLDLVTLPNARQEAGPPLEPFTVERVTITDDYDNLSSIGPTLDIDAEGNIYVTWDHDETADREGGIYFTASDDGGQSWTDPVRLNQGPETAQWPWVVAGEAGTAAVVWLQNDNVLPGQDAEDSSAGGWTVWAAQTVNAFGCGDGTAPAFNAVAASDGPVHTGTMCASGTTCQAFAIDRRMGDYFAHETDENGNIVISVSDTNMGGPVSLPLVIRQTGGPTLVQPDPGTGDPGTGDPGTGDPGTGDPGTGDPGTGDPGTGDPGTGDPGTGDPDTGDPGTGDPGTGDPGTGDPGTGDPGTGDPGTGDPGGRPSPGCAAAATDAEAPQGADRVSRVSESDAVALAVTASQSCADAASTVVLARSDDFPDALAATGLAAEVGGPVLLSPTDSLDPRVLDELQRLGTTEVILAGGTAALSAALEADLDARGFAVQRFGGPERFSTARLIAEEIVRRGGPVDTAILALGARDGGDAWPDALTAGVLSGTERAPVLLVTPDQIPGPTLDALRGLLSEGDNVIVSGGVAAIGQPVALAAGEEGFNVARVAGADRYGTSTGLAGRAIGAGASLDVVILASGNAFAGALVSGAAALAADGVMVLVHPDDLANGESTRTFLERRGPEIGQVLIAGDSSVVSDTVMAQVREIMAAS